MLFFGVYVQFLENLEPVPHWKCQDGENPKIFYLFEARSTLTLIAGHNLTLGHNLTPKS